MKKKIGIIFISLFCFVAVGAWLLTANETLASDAQEESCIVGDANYSGKFEVGDLVRLKRHLKTTELACSMDGDLDVSGDLASADVVRCREMLVGDRSLQVSVAKEDWYKKLKDADGYNAYYKLNKSLKAGRTLTFKIDFKENTNCSVYGYYPGSDEWIYIGKQGDTGRLRVVAEQDIAYLNIKVVNTDNQTEISDFRVYDIKVFKPGETGAIGAVKDLAITYNQSTDMPVVYGTSDTLDLTKFGVETNEKNLSYKWTIKQNGVDNSTKTLDMTSTKYPFTATGNYTITATVNTEGYSGSASAKIMVVNPKIYIGFDGEAVNNTGTATNTVGTYALNELKNATSFVKYSGTVNYATGINGDAKGAIVTNHYEGPYTIVKDYAFGTSNFTLSAWINVPKSAILSQGSATYLFGTMNPDGKDGFALSLKDGELRSKVLYKEADLLAISFERDSWYNITVKRQGTSFKLYFDGEMVKEYTIDKTATFGTKDLAFGAYHGFGDNAYKNDKMFYDDIQIYSGSLGDATIQALASVDAVGADVVVNFDHGKVENTGMKDTDVGTFALKSDGKDFGDFSGTVKYVKDAQGRDNGALVTNHQKGPHLVVDEFELGTDDFTISTWFQVPESNTIKLGDNSRAYLFGTDNPNTTTGFAVNIKWDPSKEEHQLRLKVGDQDMKRCKIEGFTTDTWYHLAVCRDDSDLRVYLNGKCVYTITNVTTNFDKNDISFGAGKNWDTTNYDNANVYFDDVRIYSSAVATKYIKEIYDNVVGPQVEINYTNSTVANTGADTDVAVGTYKMKATKGDDNMFVTQPSVPFTTGAAYDKGGAISTYHYDGTYTVVRDYVLGTKDFSISTWVKIPEDAEVSIGSGTYLFGNDHVATTNGFAVCLKPDELRVQLAGSTTNTGSGSISYEPGKWYHVALIREGAEVKIYFDGYVVATLSDKIKATHDFGTADLAFGAYPGPYAYKEAYTHFDEIKIYDSVLSEDSISTIAYTDLGEEEWILNGEFIIDESLPSYISNNKLFYTNDVPVANKTSGADPSCIYVTEGDMAGYYITYIGFNNSTQVKCYKSKDLVSWETADSVENRCFSPDIASSSWIAGDIWAPEVHYDAASKTYYMFFSATSKHDADGYKCLGMATSKSPIGPFTESGSPIFDGGQLAKQNTDFSKIGVIDAHPFVDPVSGDKYMYMARCRDGNVDSNIICVVKMKDWKTPDYSTFKYLTTVNKTTYGGSDPTERSETGTYKVDGTVVSVDSVNEAPQMTYHNGKYYLTMSICGTTVKEYSIIQAIGDSPAGPFTKVQQSKGGVVLGIDLQQNYSWDHFSCSGSHSFVQAGDEWFILYHTHTDPDVPGYVRSLAVDRMTWATNSDGQTVMKAMGPSKSVQPKPASYSGYANIATKATMTATNTASGSKARYLNDGLVRILSTDNINQFEASDDVTITMKFDDFVKAKSLLIYNSWNYADSFDYISNVTFTYGELVDGVRHVGTKTVNDIYFEESTYTYTNHEGKTLMIPGAPVVLSLAEGVEDLEIIEVSITIPRASGKSKVAVSEVMLLGKDFEEKADVQVSYNNGTIADASTDDAVTVGAYGLSGIDKDASSVFQKYAGAFKFTTGVAGDAKGAIVTNNASGPYTVVDGYNFGADNFTVSTWFKVPTGETIQSSGNYLFGIDNPDGTTGFSACIKTDSGAYQLRLRVLSKTLSMYNMTDFAFDTWYQLTLTRTGNIYNWYLDGELVGTYEATTIADFASSALAVGAYKGWGKGSYKNTNICFDELGIYDSSLSQEKIAALTAKYKN